MQKGAKGSKVLQKRLHKIRLRKGRLRGLSSAKKGLFKVARTGGLPSATYGCRVNGMSTSALGQLRAGFGSALFGTPKGRCRTLEFLLS
eukprot:8751752-Pyramimonas_sp.AAC.1